MNANFRDYKQQQNWLFPPSIEELIPADHPVRVVNGMIEQMMLKVSVVKNSRPFLKTQEYNA
ncbi:hypothetical protein [Ichthyobacterium seriolicida]|uniref:Transposase n=1 Tax=Ichthyobacterium seriolicida TaxID=242600 RepID=A0A1J1DXP8_9FLAO|nr:hypothetical protein [Ichthyobacterium seriolicida]BAV94639.1 transposase [Ichthyobacterium seriolicida]